ncbi:hypothetical protein ABL78_8290 [Leptomonas seymouri]|uniref:Uncharacterized protein n=1 Tax=Leptomonas seymouri TaxID=5684 RepID=A0A0N0P2M6_LEPSE|nr:hypothetical protein ABL78_8290 [Leptomonas seymouri]|eukprot:KPI82697.1 hypothetical protein ABL78_8290 [Leptomonas seymouri]
MKPTNNLSKNGIVKVQISPSSLKGNCHQKYSGREWRRQRVRERRRGVGTCASVSGFSLAASNFTCVTSSSVDMSLCSGTKRCSPCTTPSKKGDTALSSLRAAVRTAGGTHHSTPAIMRVYPPCRGTPTHRSTPRLAGSRVLTTAVPTMQLHALRSSKARCTQRASRRPHS